MELLTQLVAQASRLHAYLFVHRAPLRSSRHLLRASCELVTGTTLGSRVSISRGCHLLQGHRTLVFSQSRVMLDILQLAITAANWAFLRLDGSITSAADRAVRCCCH